jgi:hypothetical protein
MHRLQQSSPLYSSRYPAVLPYCIYDYFSSIDTRLFAGETYATVSASTPVIMSSAI